MERIMEKTKEIHLNKGEIWLFYGEYIQLKIHIKKSWWDKWWDIWIR